jgi:hypothetical protein
MVKLAANFGMIFPLLPSIEQSQRGGRSILATLGKLLELDDGIDIGAHGNVSDSRMNSITTGTRCSRIKACAVVNASWNSLGFLTRIALQPSPSATATWSTP